MPGSIIQSVLPIAATVAGYYFGGPIGALVASVVVAAVFPPKKPSMPDFAMPTFTAARQAQLVTSRQAAANWQNIYGQTRVGGVITFMAASADNQHLHQVVTLAGHVCEEVGDMYFDDELVPLSGGSATGRYAGYVYVERNNGRTDTTQPYATLEAAGVGWTSSHLQRGRAGAYVRLLFNQDLFANGVPNITFVVKGKKVYDPRTSPGTTAWSANAALCVADYICDATTGIGSVYAEEIKESQLIAAANICDEDVALNAGSPTQYENRYEINGAFDTGSTPRDVLSNLLTAMAGKAVFAGGSWWIHPAAYSAPAVTLTADDLRGTVHIQPRLSRRDLCNGIKGVYTSPDNAWQPTDFPPVTNATYLTEDQGERIWKDIELSFTDSAPCAQRIAKIELERTRQQITLALQCKLTAWQLQPGDVVMVTLDRYGYSAKPFEVFESTLVHEEDGEGGMRLGVDLLLRETAAAVYTWSAEETTVDPAPDTDLPDPFSTLTVTLGTPRSGTSELFVAGDGTVVPRIMVPITEPANYFVKEYEVEFARTAGSPQEWQSAPRVASPATKVYVYPTEDGVSYDGRVRAVTTIGNRGGWSYFYGHAVVGKTAAPSDVTGANAVQSAGLVVMGCDNVADADLDSVEVRLHDEGQTDFDDASPVANILRGQTVTSAAIQPGTWELLFKAKDTSGNYSANAARVTITVTSEGFTEIYSEDESPDWLGEKVNLLRHWTGVLVPDSQTLAVNMTDAQLWDQFCYNAYANCYYTAPVVDKGIDATARIYADIVSVLGPAEASGLANPALQVDHRTNAGSFDGFEVWTVGSVNFRHAKFRIHVDTSLGKPVISSFTPGIDAASREETGTYTTPAGGSVAVTFASPFHTAPVGTVSPQGSGDVSASWDGLTVNGFTGYFKTAGAAGAGTASYRFTGA